MRRSALGPAQDPSAAVSGSSRPGPARLSANPGRTGPSLDRGGCRLQRNAVIRTLGELDVVNHDAVGAIQLGAHGLSLDVLLHLELVEYRIHGAVTSTECRGAARGAEDAAATHECGRGRENAVVGGTVVARPHEPTCTVRVAMRLVVVDRRRDHAKGLPEARALKLKKAEIVAQLIGLIHDLVEENGAHLSAPGLCLGDEAGEARLREGLPKALDRPCVYLQIARTRNRTRGGPAPKHGLVPGLATATVRRESAVTATSRRWHHAHRGRRHARHGRHAHHSHLGKLGAINSFRRARALKT
mmetsp:Transcript_44485/g.142628  ORF Transcript_44485/g.142628 Transcript_44485/m.142628 type:complete len:301 (-) Transcript_44485:24-926(-)